MPCQAYSSLLIWASTAPLQPCVGMCCTISMAPSIRPSSMCTTLPFGSMGCALVRQVAMAFTEVCGLVSSGLHLS